MKFHDVCMIVSDMEKAIELWVGLFDFRVDAQMVFPDDALAADPDSHYPALMEEIWGIKGPRTMLALLSSPGGAKLELQQPLDPQVRPLPPEYRTYNATGVREICLYVEDIDSWFRKVKAAGYRVQTDYVWPVSETARTFAFYDHDNNLIQLWGGPETETW